jgi:hypothetical protein
MSKLMVRSATLAALLPLLSAVAAADEPPPEATVAAVPSGPRVEATFGMSASTELTSGEGEPDEDLLGTLGLILSGRHRNLLFGVKAELGTPGFGANAMRGAVLGGLILDLGPRSRVELTGEGGVHIVSGLGNGLFSHPVGGNQSLSTGYVGTRIALSFRPRSNLYLSFWMGASRDLEQQHADVLVQSCLFGCSLDTKSYEFGGTAFSAGVGVGWAGDGF